jgi:S-formylglutathione hydrolase FrmB
MLVLLIFLGQIGAMAYELPSSSATPGGNGFLHHLVQSEHQAGPTEVRVLLPDRIEPGERLPVIYVLPVEAGTEHRYGDGLTEVRKLGLHQRVRAIFVAPTFSALPWYADHPTDPTVRQESHLLRVVLPLVERRYPVRTGPGGRLLLGFSKSGWGAYSLLLRHPDLFGKAVAWDAPLMMNQPGKYGSGEIFATAENFDAYRVSRLLAERAKTLGADERLILTGYDNFREDHRKAHELMLGLGVRHVYRDGPRRSHDWHGGWVGEAVELLLKN